MTTRGTSRLKFVLLGDPGTGKTFVFEKFSQNASGSKHNAIKTVCDIDVHLYDFPISIFPSQMLFRDADAVFFLFSLTERESFENIIHKWIPLFDNNALLMKSHSSYMIVGTLLNTEKERVVENKEVCELVKLLGVPYTELPSGPDPILLMVRLLLDLGVVENKENHNIIYLSDSNTIIDKEKEDRGGGVGYCC